LSEFEQYVDDKTDTVIYSFNKMIKLLLECNPNTCEILGMRSEHYLHISEIGQELLDNKRIFLSKRAARSFGGYADAQLRRLQNALARDSFPQSEKEQHIFNSVQNALEDFGRRLENFNKGSIRLYIDKSQNPKFDTEIFIDANYTHYPLRDYENMWSVMHKLLYAIENTSLPDNPDMEKVGAFVERINERVITGDIR